MRWAHHWARTLRGLGYDARLMSAQFVKAYVKSNKNDWRDAEAICEAVGRPTMRYVPVKTVEQQSVQHLHRARSSAVGQRTALANQMRGIRHSAAYRRLPRLLTELAIARADGRYPKLLASIAKTAVLVIDDWGVSKLGAENRRDLLEIIEDRHGIRSTIVTSQLPVENWHAVVRR